MWSKADLVRRLCGALEIAGQAVRLMAANGFVDPDNPLRSIRAEKVVGETSLLLLAAGPLASTDEIRERLEFVARLLIPHARGDRVRARICLEPSLALDHSLAHACLSRLGFPDTDLDQLLSESLQAEAAGGCERPPHRQLEQEWLLRIWNPSPHSARVDARLPGRSSLGRPIDLLSVRNDDVYAFTHALMYLTDLGSRRVHLPRSQATIAAEADSACASSLDEPDYDLCGEILLTWPYLRRRWSASAIIGFAVLASVEDRVGFLPGPGISLDRLQTLSGDERSRYIVTRSYHTAYVMGLLCAAALRDGCIPPACPPAQPRHRGATAKLMQLIGPAHPEPDWKQHLDGQPFGEPDSAAPLLLNICLRRAATRRDLGVIRSALLIGEHHGLLDAPAPRQAAELLRRSATFASLPPVVPPIQPVPFGAP
jgi:hypothetical protein